MDERPAHENLPGSAQSPQDKVAAYTQQRETELAKALAEQYDEAIIGEMVAERHIFFRREAPEPVEGSRAVSYERIVADVLRNRVTQARRLLEIQKRSLRSAEDLESEEPIGPIV